MDCTLCHLKFSVISELKKHYVDFHGVEESNPYFQELFQSDTLDRKCKKCSVVFRSSTDMVDVFLDIVYNTFKPKGNLSYKFQGYFEIINQQREPERTDKRVSLTNVFCFKHFNQFVRGEIKDEIIKGVIANGQTGSSWYFKRFNRINIIVVPLLNELKIITG